MLEQSFLADLRAATDIVVLASEYTTIAKKGREYVGRCIFHNEKTPSMYLSRGKGLFFCHGCHAGGDTLAFVMKAMGLDFREAAEYLAERANLPMPQEERRAHTREARLPRRTAWQVNALAMKFWQDDLHGLRGAKAREYLRKRGVSQETAMRFCLGYAGTGTDDLANYLEAQGADMGVALALGLISRDRDEAWMDRYRGRLMFPIRGLSGEVLGFSGRYMGETTPQIPKYLNSSESEVWQKSKTLYGLYEAREALRQSSKAIVCEGNIDLLALVQGGFAGSVSTLGTALGAEHLTVLERLGIEEAHVLYDGDKAGEEASVRAAGLALLESFPMRVSRLPKGQDPDTYLRQEGAEALKGLMESQGHMAWDWLVERSIQKHSGQTGPSLAMLISKDLKEVLAPLPQEGRVLYTKHLARRLGVGFDEVAHFFSNESKRSVKPQDEPKQKVPKAPSLSQEEAELLGLLANNERARALFLGHNIQALLSSSEVRKYAELLCSEKGALGLNALPPAVAAEVAQAAIDSASRESLSFEAIEASLKAKEKKRKLESVNSAFVNATKRGDEKEALRLLQEWQALQ